MSTHNNLNESQSFCWVKEADLKGLHTAWLCLWAIWKRQNYIGTETSSWLPGLRGGWMVCYKDIARGNLGGGWWNHVSSWFGWGIHKFKQGLKFIEVCVPQESISLHDNLNNNTVLKKKKLKAISKVNISPLNCSYVKIFHLQRNHYLDI